MSPSRPKCVYSYEINEVIQKSKHLNLNKIVFNELKLFGLKRLLYIIVKTLFVLKGRNKLEKKD